MARLYANRIPLLIPLGTKLMQMSKKNVVLISSIMYSVYLNVSYFLRFSVIHAQNSL